MVQEIAKVEDFPENERRVQMSFWNGTCPFRGHPFKAELDERCPFTLRAFLLPVMDKPLGSEGSQHVHPIPILEEESYCGKCTTERIREAEAGKASDKGDLFSKRRKATHRSQKEQVAAMAAQIGGEAAARKVKSGR